MTKGQPPNYQMAAQMAYFSRQQQEGTNLHAPLHRKVAGNFTTQQSDDDEDDDDDLAIQPSAPF